jgi:hypothetical protein
MKKTIIIVAIICFLIGAFSGQLLLQRGASAPAVPTTPQPVWSEMAWPFPMDQWGKGKAFQCKAAD